MDTLKVTRHAQWVEICLARPDVRNAMSFQMVEELRQLFAELKEDGEVQAVLLRGEGGHFCAGGDIKDMRTLLSGQAGGKDLVDQSEVPSDSALANDHLARANRQFGYLLSEIQSAPQVVIVVLEGAVMGGGFGLACVSDIALALPSAKFGLPEVTLGLTPAQIAPFVVKRIGITRTRHLALTGARFNADRALAYGLIHELCADETELSTRITEILSSISRCAPQARVATKELVLSVAEIEVSQYLDDAALGFSTAIRDGEGMAGMMAFVTKQPAAWQSAWGEIKLKHTIEASEQEGGDV